MNIKFSGFIPVERRNLMIKTESKFAKFPAKYLLTEEATEKATNLLLEKLEKLGLIESYWVNYCLYWFCKNHLEHHSKKSCECCARMNEKRLSKDHIAISIYHRYNRVISSTSRVVSEKLQLAPLNHSFCDYFKNVSNNEISFSKKEGFYFNNINGGEFSFEPILGDCLNIFDLEEKIPGFKRTTESIDIYNVILKTIKQYPRIIGNYAQKYEDVNGNCVLLSSNGLNGSFYDKLTKFLDKFLVKVCKEGTLLNNQDDYIKIMKDELGEFFGKVHKLILDFTREEIKKYFKFVFDWTVMNLYDLLNKIEEYPHNFIFKSDYEHSHKLFLIPGELKRFPFEWLSLEEQKFVFLSSIVFHRDGKIENSNFKSLTSKFLENKGIYLQYTKNVILERIDRYYFYDSYQFRNSCDYITKELEEIESCYNSILNLFEEEEDPELVQEIKSAMGYLKELSN